MGGCGELSDLWRLEELLSACSDLLALDAQDHWNLAFRKINLVHSILKYKLSFHICFRDTNFLSFFFSNPQKHYIMES